MFIRPEKIFECETNVEMETENDIIKKESKYECNTDCECKRKDFN